MINCLLAKLRNLLRRGYVSRTVTDDGDYPLAQISYLNNVGISERISPYGLDSQLPQDTQVLLFTIQGHETNRACIGYSQDERFKNLDSGEVVVGNPVKQTSIKFDKTGKIIITSDGDIDITATGKNVNIDAAQTNLGSGGNAIARLGDEVTVNVGGTDYIGTITSAGNNTSI
jgi:hypothetical protein